MKTFYLFKINSMFKNKETALYKIFKKLYNDFDENLYNRLLESYDENLINIFLLSKHIDEFYYYKKNNNHYIDNAIETSYIQVNNKYIKIETNNINNSFFTDLLELNEDLFVIDFDNNEYFWLNKYKMSIILT